MNGSTELKDLCVHQVTLLEQCDFRQFAECCARNDITKTAVWRDKLESVGADEAARMLSDNGISAVALCAGGNATQLDESSWKESLDANIRLLNQAAIIGAESLVVITGGLPQDSKDLVSARLRAKDRLASLLPHAKSVGIKLALEPLSPIVCGYRSVISTMKEANDWLDEIGAESSDLGIALDSYAVWWEPELEAEIRRAGNRLLHFHAADWLRDTKDVRLDRGMPGDGFIDNRSIWRWMREAGYSGSVEIEIFSVNNWWKRDPDEVMGIIKQRFVDHF